MLVGAGSCIELLPALHGGAVVGVWGSGSLHSSSHGLQLGGEGQGGVLAWHMWREGQDVCGWCHGGVEGVSRLHGVVWPSLGHTPFTPWVKGFWGAGVGGCEGVV